MPRAEDLLRSAATVIVLLVIQTTLIPFISVAGVVPDLLLIWVVLTALRRGQIEATVGGFIVGLLQDLVATKFFGLAALSKTITGFVLGYFHNENTTESTLGSYRFVTLVLLAGIVHNLLFFFIFLQGLEGGIFFDVLLLSLGVTVYTGAIGVLPMFAYSRRYQTAILR
jgi:rod shape-determining protein MreD